MNLSEREKKILNNLEQEIIKNDRNFSQHFKNFYTKDQSYKHIIKGIFILFLGLICFIIGISISYIFISLTGFFIITIGIYAISFKEYPNLKKFMKYKIQVLLNKIK